MTAAPAGTDWTTSAVEEVATGVHRIPLPLPNDNLKAVNVYAVEDGDGLTLIDSGWAIPESKARLDTALRSMGSGLAEIRQFLITHAHRDHFTQAIEVRRDWRTKVALGAGERQTIKLLQDLTRRPLEPQLQQLRRYGAETLVERIVATSAEHEPPDRSIWESPDEYLVEGELTLTSGRVLSVIETPGHTRGHVVFRDDAGGLLFAGDHVLPRITPSIGFEPQLSDNPLADFLGSLAKVRQLPDSVLLPAHGPVAPSVHARIDELIDHHGHRLDETVAALEAGATTAFEVANILRWTRRAAQLGELDYFNQMLAVAETGAHLTLLVAQGRASRSEDEGVYQYLTAD
jgi:glyoxylase-like metal-dependent hydrolase (beta-lactamase superfamily II)